MAPNALQEFLANRQPPPSQTMTVIEENPFKVVVFDKTSRGRREMPAVAFHGLADVVAAQARRLGHRGIEEHLLRLHPASCALVLPWGHEAPPLQLSLSNVQHRQGQAVAFLRSWLRQEMLVDFFFAPAARKLPNEEIYDIQRREERAFWAGAGFSAVTGEGGDTYFFCLTTDMPKGY